jgi:hypothetical protein
VSLFLDIGTGTGLAGSTGVRPYLPPLVVGVLASADAGIDFDGTDWSFLESPPFLLVVLLLAVVAYGLERSAANRPPPNEGRTPAQIVGALAGVVLGALLFAGALADGDEPAWIGLVAGPLCALLAWAAVGGLVERARGRLQGGAAALLSLYADAAAVLLALAAVFVPPLSYLALVVFAVLLLRARGRQGEKYAGLRILR